MTIVAAAIGLWLTAGYGVVHPIAIMAFAMIACRSARSEVTMAMFAFTLAILLRGILQLPEFDSVLANIFGSINSPLPFSHYVVSASCVFGLFITYRYWSAEPVHQQVALANVKLDSMAQSSSADTDDFELTVASSASENQVTKHDQPTHFTFPRRPAKVPHLAYDNNPDDVLEELVARMSPQDLLLCLAETAMTIPRNIDLAANTGPTASALVESLISSGTLTKYQAMLLCGGSPDLLWIGPYEVLERIGRGGMAIVLKVREQHTKHLYALKLLANVDTMDEVLRNRFLREMEAVRELAHPNIAVAKAVGQHNQLLYIVMELVQGSNLAHYVFEHGPLNTDDAIDYIRQAAGALDHAHQRKLVHRDVKPANLILGKNQEIKLVDMGLARFIDAIERQSEAQTRDWQTSAGHLMGTIDYMAPEQALDLGQADQRSDIYSLGGTFFYLLTGESHLRGRTLKHRAVGLVNQTGMRNLVDARADLPPCIYSLVSKMMMIDPNARFQSIAELMMALDSCAVQFGMPAQVEKSYRVLVVEDSKMQSILTCRQLKSTSQHFIPVDVQTLTMACECLQNETFELVLLDLNLPDSSGIGTIERVREVHETIPILVLTGTNDFQVGVQCIAAGADDYLPKDELSVSTLERHILLTLSRREVPVA